MVIVQAYEAATTPPWIQRCLQSVKAWAEGAGFAYRFSPTLFDRIPEWFRQHCAPEIGPLTDLGRLCLMQALFDEGEEAVVWVDADVLVFDPAGLHVPRRPGFLVIDEVTVGSEPNGTPVISERGVNGALLGASRGNATFDAYRQAIESVVREAPAGKVPRTVAGPQLLTQLAKQHAMERLTTVGLFTPAMLADLAHGKENLPRAFSLAFGHRVAAANLCHFFRDMLLERSVPVYDDAMMQAIDRLLESRGEIVNRYLSGN
jgi:hypothetical protein